MASTLERAERFIAEAGFDRAPWLAVAFGCGIAAWFVLPGPAQWLALLAAALAVACLAMPARGRETRHPYLRQAAAGLAVMVAAGCVTVWIKSALVGAPGIDRPVVGTVTGQVVSREEQPAEQRSRLVLAIRDPSPGAPAPGRVINVRVNVPAGHDRPDAETGAIVRLRARLMPPAPPMVPDAYDFARTAWFARLSATGSAIGPVEIVRPAPASWGNIGGLRRALSSHVRSQVAGSPGGIAAAFASGDRGGIAPDDEQAMRDSGLTHLLSVSGLHVSAVIGGAYILVIRLLALWPWLALRVRLPLLAAGVAAGTGVFYALLTGAEVPTVRSVLGALLVLTAVALGRDALSVRLLAVAGLAVMLIWPESVVGPSFQLSFGAVLTIIAVHASTPMRRFTAPRSEPFWTWIGRHLANLLITGLAIELALMPIGLFHFHRAGLYGSLANVMAIPLTTFITMPLIALALMLDLVGMGGPVWWAVGKSLELLLGLAHFVAGQPGAVTMLPGMGRMAFSLFVAGGLWLALWQGRRRLLGLPLIAVGTSWLALISPPDVLVSGDGRHVAFATLAPDTLVVLREGRSSFARDSLTENTGMDGRTIALEQWPTSRCNADFCSLTLNRGGRDWSFLIARGKDTVPLRDLVAACERADVVIADRRLPTSCRPRALKADRSLLDRTGGIAMDLASGKVQTVAETQGRHGWWRPRAELARPAVKSDDAATGPDVRHNTGKVGAESGSPMQPQQP